MPVSEEKLRADPSRECKPSLSQIIPQSAYPLHVGEKLRVDPAIQDIEPTKIPLAFYASFPMHGQEPRAVMQLSHMQSGLTRVTRGSVYA